MSLVGTTFSVTAYDGYAKYEVREERDDMVLIVRVPQYAKGHPEYGDIGYAAPLLGEMCWVSRRNVEEVLEFDRRWRAKTRPV